MRGSLVALVLLAAVLVPSTVDALKIEATPSPDTNGRVGAPSTRVFPASVTVEATDVCVGVAQLGLTATTKNPDVKTTTDPAAGSPLPSPPEFQRLESSVNVTVSSTAQAAESWVVRLEATAQPCGPSLVVNASMDLTFQTGYRAELLAADPPAVTGAVGVAATVVIHVTNLGNGASKVTTNATASHESKIDEIFAPALVSLDRGEQKDVRILVTPAAPGTHTVYVSFMSESIEPGLGGGRGIQVRVVVEATAKTPALDASMAVAAVLLGALALERRASKKE